MHYHTMVDRNVPRSQSPLSWLRQLSKSSESAQLDAFIADYCFQLLVLAGERGETTLFFTLTKTHPYRIEETLAGTHTSVVWQRAEQSLFPRRVDGGGEECPHLCRGYFLFYCYFLKNASERCGERTGQQSQSLYLMFVHV